MIPTPLRTLRTLFIGAAVGVAIAIGIAYPVLKDRWADLKDRWADVDATPTTKSSALACANAQPQSPKDVSSSYTAGTATPTTPGSVQTTIGSLGKANVHFHLHAEHKSAGEYDTPTTEAGKYGYDCGTLEGSLTTAQKAAYAWEYCKETEVGETYEIHWVYSSGAGSTISDGLGGAFTYQNNPFVVVRAQVFVITNDSADDLPSGADLFDGWRSDSITDAVAYLGSTTGTSYNNTDTCSPYSVTWQVDRKCQRISAKSFDAMCKTMKSTHGMDDDLHPHSSRMLVADNLASKTQTAMTSPFSA